MPFRPIPIRFYNVSGSVFGRYEETLSEPVSGIANGVAVDLTYTQRAGEVLVAAQIGGPPGRCRVDVSTNGGGLYVPATGVVVNGAFKIRGVALPFAGDDTEASTFALATVGEGEDANWTGS